MAWLSSFAKTKIHLQLTIVNRPRDRLRDLTLGNTAVIQELAAQMARFEERLDNLEIRVQYLNSIRDPSFSSGSPPPISPATPPPFDPLPTAPPLTIIRLLHEVIDLTNEDWKNQL